jgi:ATP-dependent DNA helicase RecG
VPEKLTETETLELKRTTGELNEAIVSMTAMLNKSGYGKVYFGVSPKGKVCSQTITEETLRDISHKIGEQINPQVAPKIQIIQLDDQDVIQVEVEGQDKPYSARGLYYIRIADEDKKVEPPLLRQLFKDSPQVSWENVLTNTSCDELDKDLLLRVMESAKQYGRLDEKVKDMNDFLNAYHLAKDGFLTNAGCALFKKNMNLEVKLGYYATGSKVTPLDLKTVRGNIFSLIDECVAYISNHIDWAVTFKEMERVETPEIPIEVIRELLANSFAHCQYDTNVVHQVDIFSDKITVTSPGSFVTKEITPDDYVRANLPTVYRNQNIAKVLYISKVIEAYGTGFQRVYVLCDANQNEHSYLNTPFCFSFSVSRKRNNILNKEPAAQRVYELLQSDPSLSIAQMAKKLDKSPSTIQKALNSLKAKGSVTRVGSNKKGYWKTN